MVQNEKKFCLLHSISQESYTISFPFIVHMGKIISPRFFYISSKFWFSGLFGRQKGKKQSKMRKKNSICHAPYLRDHTSYDFHLQYIHIKWWYLQEFCSFFQNLDSPRCLEDKWTKIVQRDKQFCLPHSISQEPYIIRLFVVYKSKMMISPGVFFIFSIFFFCFCLGGGVVRRVKEQKAARNDKKFCLPHSYHTIP